MSRHEQIITLALEKAVLQGRHKTWFIGLDQIKTPLQRRRIHLAFTIVENFIFITW